MKSICRDLGNEYDDLAGLATGLSDEQWASRSGFHGWTPWDEIAHLCFFDEKSLLALDDGQAFERDARALMAEISKGAEISAIAREKYRTMAGGVLVEHWRRQYRDLVGKLGALDAKARLPWYGPPMSARGFATARLMETWAHGQDVWDVIRRRRPATGRLKHIAHLGVITMGWTFANRGLEMPPMAPLIELAGPGGETWTWGEADSRDFVRGPAEDFCLVVTQRRHVDDTELKYSLGPVKDWLLIAQCFAGPVMTGPAPGVRRVIY